jgi:hypothetical protein
VTKGAPRGRPKVARQRLSLQFPILLLILGRDRGNTYLSDDTGEHRRKRVFLSLRQPLDVLYFKNYWWSLHCRGGGLKFKDKKKWAETITVTTGRKEEWHVPTRTQARRQALHPSSWKSSSTDASLGDKTAATGTRRSIPTKTGRFSPHQAPPHVETVEGGGQEEPNKNRGSGLMVYRT